ASARRLMQRFAVRSATAATVRAWLHETSRTTYLCDVRTPEEFAAGSIPGAVHAPGGQLIQATDQWIGVRGSRIVLIDGGENVRAPVVASWLQQLGYESWVLEDGIRSGLAGFPVTKPHLPALPGIPGTQLKQALDAGRCCALDLGASMDFRKAHVPGSRWSTRSRVAADARKEQGSIVLVAGDPDVARLAAVELFEAGFSDVKLLDGGLSGWTREGYATVSSLADPPDAECVDHLFFVHDRHAGNRDAMRQYLAWETGLLAQLDEDEKASFRIPAR
ncbi:MAG TPA: rhodanese-like domain-containing protein, partial [Burkholderiales bacterium]|nr:rhodanese-like domain-containing protein [Burkholderiales bacterium]